MKARLLRGCAALAFCFALPRAEALTTYTGTITGTVTTPIHPNSQPPGIFHTGDVWVLGYSYESETADGFFTNEPFYISTPSSRFGPVTGPLTLFSVRGITAVSGPQPFFSQPILLVENGLVTVFTQETAFIKIWTNRWSFDDLTGTFPGGSVVYSAPQAISAVPDIGPGWLGLAPLLCAAVFHR